MTNVTTGFRICFEIPEGIVLKTHYHPLPSEPMFETEDEAWSVAKLSSQIQEHAVNIYVVDQDHIPVAGYDDKIMRKYQHGLISNTKIGFKICFEMPDGSKRLFPENDMMFLTPYRASSFHRYVNNPYQPSVYKLRTHCHRAYVVNQDGERVDDQYIKDRKRKMITVDAGHGGVH